MASTHSESCRRSHWTVVKNVVDWQMHWGLESHFLLCGTPESSCVQLEPDPDHLFSRWTQIQVWRLAQAWERKDFSLEFFCHQFLARRKPWHIPVSEDPRSISLSPRNENLSVRWGHILGGVDVCRVTSMHQTSASNCVLMGPLASATSCDVCLRSFLLAVTYKSSTSS